MDFLSLTHLLQFLFSSSLLLLLSHWRTCTCTNSVLLLVIKMVTEYCMCANDLPTLVTDVMGRLVDILKVISFFSSSSYSTHYLENSSIIETPLFLLLQYFNSRTCQLVLGAGAVEAVGLKAITARHMGE